jgi:hypothetical protein
MKTYSPAGLARNNVNNRRHKVVRDHRIVEHPKTEPLLGFEEPTQVAVSVAGLEKRETLNVRVLPWKRSCYGL